MTTARGRRAEVLAELASARRWGEEVRAASLRRAADLGRLCSGVAHQDARAALHAARAELAALAECADGLLAALSGDLAEIVAAIPDEPDEGCRGPVT